VNIKDVLKLIIRNSVYAIKIDNTLKKVTDQEPLRT